MSRIQPPRGMKDFLPEEMAKRQLITDTMREVCERFGFGPLDTPGVESWDLLSRKGVGGDEIKEEIYYFRDKSGRELGLRFDLTVPLARVVANNPALKMPFKRYHSGKVWRYDRPQAGRMREFLQMDADVAGAAGMGADTECMAVAMETLNRLGFKGMELRLNNRKVLNGLMEFVKIPKRSFASVFRTLDKMEKVPREGIVRELKSKGVEAPKIRKLMEMTRIGGNPKKILSQIGKTLKGIGAAEEGIRELSEICGLSRSYGFYRSITIDLGLVRGLEYYTGPIFEIKLKTKLNVGSVAGGGRYDNLIGLYGGRSTPATGISLGIERIREIMESENMFDKLSGGTEVFVVSVKGDVRKDAVKAAQKLREAGIRTETDVTERDMGRQLEYADRKGIPYALIVGPKEIKSGKFTLRDMKTGKETRSSLGKTIEKLK